MTGTAANATTTTGGDESRYEVVGGSQRLAVLHELGHETAPCVLAEVDDARARLLSQALNRIVGQDNPGLRAALLKDVLQAMPPERVLNLLASLAEFELASLVVPEADITEEAGKLLLDMSRLWAGATMEERRRLLLTVLDAVYVDTQGDKRVVEIRPKAAFQSVWNTPNPSLRVQPLGLQLSQRALVVL